MDKKVMEEGRYIIAQEASAFEECACNSSDDKELIEYWHSTKADLEIKLGILFCIEKELKSRNINVTK